MAHFTGTPRIVASALESGLGIQPLEERFAEIEAAEPQVVAPGRPGSFLERFMVGLGGMQAPPGTTFGQGLVSGLMGGLGARGRQIQAEQLRTEALQRERQRQIDIERREAGRQHRQELGLTARDIAREGRQEERELAREERKEARESIIVTEGLKLEHPELGRLSTGATLPKSVYEALLKNKLIPKDPKAEAREQRAAEAAERAAAAAARQERLAQVRTLDQLAKAYQRDPAIKGYQMVRSNLLTAEAAAKEESGPGDIALIFSFMRALEPENVNVVREGEFANARSAAGQLQRFVNLPNRFFAGTQLTTEGRQYFLKTMRSALKSRKPDFDVASKQFNRWAEIGGVDPKDVFRDYTPPPGAVEEGELEPEDSPAEFEYVPGMGLVRSRR